jgi:hypothetical protein
MEMEKLVMRGGVWLFVALLLLLAAAASSDWAFSVHMSIACLAALIAAFASGKGFDFLSQRYPVLSADNASKYDVLGHRGFPRRALSSRCSWPSRRSTSALNINFGRCGRCTRRRSSSRSAATR